MRVILGVGWVALLFAVANAAMMTQGKFAVGRPRCRRYRVDHLFYGRHRVAGTALHP